MSQRKFVLQVFLFLTMLVGVSSCSLKRIIRTKNITYLNSDSVANKVARRLDIYAPRKKGAPADVFIFIHGGSWNSGTKSLYSFLGNRMARKGILTAIIEYPLSPEAQFQQMASASAKAVQWVKNNINQYGGNPDRIFVSGHSAGGQLAAIIAIRPEYFDSLSMPNPVKGLILIDAAGLDMYGYLKEEKLEASHPFLRTFSTHEDIWKQASPLYFLHANMPPMYILMGEKTYPSIEKSTAKFVAALKEKQANYTYQVLKGKKHKAMITQFLYSKNPRYRQIIEFMQRVK
ncbi:alpha/beta hydrolase [Rhodocytophaga rosea]|uniref:Alpha/beta hydrolase n=1 Tax=Rhodocytophaga rosea TaxID=2704465 RepID=A0A6C0GCC8_9BACT|nr:alpha/beta hydrolase [Rhodocytophaga rosea]QHT65538.1 alpha/beta hydrolase [Rhodocytophaga rosea]